MESQLNFFVEHLVASISSVKHNDQSLKLCSSTKIEHLSIGEHIDYCGYSVLPMAIDQDIVSVFSTTDDDHVYIHNTDPSYSYELQ